MPQELESAIASPRSTGYKPGDEVTVGGQSFSVVGTNQDGLPLLAPKSGFREDMAAPAAKTVSSPGKAGTSTDLISKVMAKRDRIASLPESVRGVILDRLFDKAISPRIPKAMNDEQKGQIRQNFENAILGQRPQMLSAAPGEADFKRSGLPTGAGGKVQEGVMGGLGNILSFVDKASNKFDDLMDLLSSSKSRPDPSNMAAPFQKAQGALSEATSAYQGRHPFKAGAAEFGGQLLPAILMEKMVMPGTGGGLPGKIATGAAKGGAGMIPFDPTPKGIGTGAVIGGASPILGKAVNKAKAALFPTKAVTKVAPAAATAVAGAAEGSEAKLEALAQKTFSKSLRELSPDQKIELVNKWRDESVAAAKTEKVAARKAAIEAKNLHKKISELLKMKTQESMDEAKAIQKNLAAFIKQNKRAPNEQELSEIKRFVENNPGSNVTLHGGKVITVPIEDRGAGLAARKPGAASVIPERGKTLVTSEQVERRQLPRSTRAQLYTSELSQIRKDIAEAATPEEKTYHEQRLTVKMDEYKKAMETPLADQFRVESPEAIKAVSAVADVSKVSEQIKPKVPEVQVIPEGQHGAGPLGKRAKDAERVAKARELAKAMQPEPAAPGTPESALLAKEEEFMNLTDQIEALGPKGKEAAKNLDKFRRTGKITMDMAIEMGGKVLETLQKGAVK
jgi:hypothetical protein